MKEFAEDNSKLDENGRKFSKQVEKGKGAISPFPTVFSKAFNCKHVKPGLVLERVNIETCFCYP